MNIAKNNESIPQLMDAIGASARVAAGELAKTDAATRDRALQAAAAAIIKRSDEIVAANARDMEAARSRKLSPAMLDRLALDAIESLDPEELFRTVTERQISMCGMGPCVVVMHALRRLGELTRAESVGYATSADASGDTNRVVGYAGMLLG